MICENVNTIKCDVIIHGTTGSTPGSATKTVDLKVFHVATSFAHTQAGEKNSLATKMVLFLFSSG